VRENTVDTMAQLLQQAVGFPEPTTISSHLKAPAVQTDAVSVIYTGFDETLRAVRVGADLATKMGVPLRVVHFRTVPRQLDVDRPDGLSPIESEAFANRLFEDGISARARVYLCRDEAKTIPYAFKPHSIVVVGGHHSWLPTRIERWRHALEDAGHFVVLVDPSEQKEHVHA
jgi:hypothetical protein